MNLIKVSSSTLSRNIVRHFSTNRSIHTGVTLLKKSFYDVLRVPTSASQTEIKEAYYKLSKVYHPDIAQDENSLKMFRSITEAYDILGNVKSRLQYDRETGIPVVATDRPLGSTTASKDLDDGVIAPDYNKILSKKSAQEQWEDEEYVDRRKEVLRAKHNWYVETGGHLNDQEKRVLIFLMSLIVVFTGLRILDYRLDGQQDW